MSQHADTKATVTTIGYGERLRGERQRLKMSQAQFAEMAGVSRATQAYYELEQRVPDLNYLGTIAGQVDVLFIMTGERNAHQPKKVDASVIEDILNAIEDWASESGRRLTNERRSELVAVFLEQALDKGRIDTDWMGKMLRLVK